MRLRILDHLHAMLDGPQQAICLGELVRHCAVETVGSDQRFYRVQRRGSPHRGIAAAVDHLLNLYIEFRFTDSAAAALQVESRTDRRPLSEMIANPRGDLTNFFDDSEVQRAAPNERRNRMEEALAERDIAGGRSGADEGGALPRLGARFIVRDGRIDGED